LRVGRAGDGQTAGAENAGDDCGDAVRAHAGRPCPPKKIRGWSRALCSGPLPGRTGAPPGRLLVFDSHASSPNRKCRLRPAARPSEAMTLVPKRLLCDRNVPGARPGRSQRAARFSETTGTDRAVILDVDV